MKPKTQRKARLTPTDQEIDNLAAKLHIRVWDQCDDGFGGEWFVAVEKLEAIRDFWNIAFMAGQDYERAGAGAAEEGLR